MKRNLKRAEGSVWHYNDAGERVEGPPAGVCGDLSGVRGNLTGVRGDLSGVWGNLSGVCGDIDDCDLSPEERARGVHIDELIGG